MRLLILSDLHLEFRAPQSGNVCSACGDRFRLGTWNEGATWYRGHCGVCHQKTDVTEPRDYGLLGNDWNLRLPGFRWSAIGISDVAVQVRIAKFLNGVTP